MESFFPSAFYSVLEATGAVSRGSRSTRNSSSSSISTAGGRNTTRSNTSAGTSGNGGGNTWRINRFGSRAGPEHAASSPVPSGPIPTSVPSEDPQPETFSAAGAARDGSGAEQAANVAGHSKFSSSNSVAQDAPSSSSSSSSAPACAEKNVNRSASSTDTAGKAPVKDREAADRMKELGNESFRRGMYGLAAEYYSKAIAADATVASYFTNRALCHKRENRYAEALQDAEAALALEEMNVKGLYIKGDALVQLGMPFLG